MIDLNDYRTRRGPATVGDAMTGFADAVSSAGLGRPEIHGDGKLHRFDVPNEKRGKKSGWFILFLDNIPSGAFGSFKHDISENWCSRANYEMSAAELKMVRERQRQAKEARDALAAQRAEDCAVVADRKWSQASETDTHPYLKAKKVGAFGVRVEGAELLVPMWNAQGRMVSLQRVYADGKKRFLDGTPKKGAVGWIEGDQNTVYLAEGYATAASVHMATGAAAAMAWDAGNLEPAAQTLKSVMPHARIVIAADNDRWTMINGSPVNVGLEKAHAAAQAIGATVVWPEFESLDGAPTDFNDLHVREGLDAVRAQVKGYNVRLRDWSLARLSGKPIPERLWLVDQTIPLGAAIILAAPGGTGKGILTLDMAIKVAGTPAEGIDLSGADQVMGHAVMAHGPAVLLAAEDDQDEVHRRARTLCGCDEFPEGLFVVCMPDLDGPKGIIHQGKAGGLEITSFWREIEEQVLRLRPKLVVVDPLSCFVFADLNDRNVGAHVMGLFTTLARKSGASVIVVHHLNKLGKDRVATLDQARTAISGSAGFVDHGRGAYVFWPEEESRARDLCKQLEIEFERHRIIRGGLAKNNYPGDTREQVYLRQENGLLVTVDRAAKEIAARMRSELLDLLERAVAQAAEQGLPFQHTGRHGLFEKRERLPEKLRTRSKHVLDGLGRQLLDTRRIDKYRPASGGKSEVWLDVPTGPFAQGVGELSNGEFEVMHV